MAPRGKTNPSVDERTVILALECPSLEQAASSSHRRTSRPRPRLPAVCLPTLANILCPCIITIHTGQDIGETIRAFFEENHHNIRSMCEGISLEGRIFTVSGDVSNPRINLEGSMSTIFEGNYSIATLLGCYIFRTDGTVEQDHLKLSFQPGDYVVGGSVVGPLIAGCEVQVTVGYAKLNDGIIPQP